MSTYYYVLVCYVLGVVSVLAEESPKITTVDFSRCSASQALEGQDGWATVKNCVSPAVREILVGDRIVRVAGAPAKKTEPTDLEAKKTSQIVRRISPPFANEKPSTILVQADMMTDGYPPAQCVMAGFGLGTPIQFGLDLSGSVGVRDDQWGAVRTVTDVNGRPFEPRHDVWYRLTLEITFKKSDTVRLRLFLRDLFGKDRRVPANKDVLLLFDRQESVDVPIKFPMEKWDTFWLRTSDTSIFGNGGFLSAISLHAPGKRKPESDYVAASLSPIYQPIRTSEELERLIDLKKSDVLLSSRWKRPRDKDDPYDTFKAIADFHATRLEWAYTVTPEFVRETKEKGGVRRFGGTVNTMFKTGRQYSEKALPGHLTNRDDKPVTGPWMLPLSLWWGCVNSDEFKASYIDRLERLIEAGADTIHMDDPGLNLAAIKWGACFCPYCVRGYKQFLKESGLPHSADMTDPRTMERPPHFTEFQEESVRRFYQTVRKTLREKSGRDIMFSCNNYAGDWPFPAVDFDFGIAEIAERNMKPEYIFRKMREAERLGKLQVFTFVSRDDTLNRRSFAATYASGGHSIVPWDAYIPPTTSPRHFTTPERFADLTGFVRGIADRLDGYRTGLAAGFGFDASSSEGILVSTTHAGKETSVSIFLRKKDAAPPVLHLVAWGRPEETRIRIPLKVMGLKEIPKTISLLTPLSYDAGKNQNAEATGDYGKLVQSQPIAVQPENEHLVFTVPPFGDWGTVVFGE